MLRLLKDLENYAISATDGKIGHIKDFYFDDDAWVTRYVVVDAGTWLSSRRVLISPIAVQHPNWFERALAVSITKEQVKNSPEIDTKKPVSRQHEEAYFGYYGYPQYWGGVGIWGESLYPNSMMPGGLDTAQRERELEAHLRLEKKRHRHDDPHLRSCNEIVGYRIHASDGDIGHVCGFLIDDETWAVRYLVIDTSNWWIGHKVLIAPQWIKAVDWPEQSVSVDLSRELIKTAPPFDTAQNWTREDDGMLYRHYERTGYWSDFYSE
jgi:PRC-barrel domain